MTNDQSSWSRVCIKDVCTDIVDCINKTAPTVGRVTPYKMIRTTNVKNGWVDLGEVRYVTEEVFHKWSRRVLPQKGDILLTREAPLGEVGMLRDSDSVFLGQRLVLYRANEEIVDRHFLLYSLMANDLQAQIKAYGSGSTVEHMRVPDAEKLMISLPLLSVQRKIGRILSAYDDLIENNNRRIKILEEMAQMLYREWFVDFRFPGHEQVKMVESECGLRPEGWAVLPLLEAVRINPTMKVSREGEKPYVDMAGLSATSMVISHSSRRSGNSGSKFVNGDTLFARITPCLENGKTGFVQFLRENEIGLGSTEFIVFRSSSLTPEYVYLLSRTDGVRDIAIKSMSGASGRQRVQVACFDEFKVVVPSKPVLNRFSETMEPVFRQVQVLFAQSNILRCTRDLLLPKLISGELDVSELDIDVGDE